MTWAPHVTVATIIERDNRYLMVYEEADGNKVYNQPAGHLDPNETLQEAAIRETLEETGWTVALTGVVGVNLYTAPSNGITYFRTTFIAKALSHDTQRPLDTGIIEAVWLSYEELVARKDQLRSPMTLQIIEEYRAGRRFPLEVVG
ncbi:NUDIX hydrolase [Cellvibrio mixtus]|jgi:8-oxo-dGTP pyrophosphatase MutT (NUDIX family)|uniref:Phosphatase NudJ n=1 Tax=Cellvibrio mixtus TaxID=39650 RepID=A0A266Q491_9GAMM|nr:MULTISPECIES: NUDIX hydrolase [Cellvibrio]AQT59114.1 NUDIX hydrolase [Cellvibrio sp. PSBB023]OZY84665.1 NUDIX hydrolase [Cellvibrio mixtus]